MPKADLDLEKTRGLARQMRVVHFPTFNPVPDPDGRSACHMAWMLNKIINDPDMTLAKASRWLGYVQGWLVFHYHRELEDIKHDVREVRDH